VLANEVQMRQVFSNLVANALDAMDATPERILELRSQAYGENAIRIDVADTGMGLSPAIKTKLFEPLVTTKARGLGVGLSIAHSIVQEHQGQIWAQTNRSCGTTFAVVLPLALEDVRPD
jgi:C4-dicarboxylate-specific signal transduction histidine kinase